MKWITRNEYFDVETGEVLSNYEAETFWYIVKTVLIKNTFEKINYGNKNNKTENRKDYYKRAKNNWQTCGITTRTNACRRRPGQRTLFEK